MRCTVRTALRCPGPKTEGRRHSRVSPSTIGQHGTSDDSVNFCVIKESVRRGVISVRVMRCHGTRGDQINVRARLSYFYRHAEILLPFASAEW